MNTPTTSIKLLRWRTRTGMLWLNIVKSLTSALLERPRQGCTTLWKNTLVNYAKLSKKFLVIQGHGSNIIWIKSSFLITVSSATLNDLKRVSNYFDVNSAKKIRCATRSGLGTLCNFKTFWWMGESTISILSCFDLIINPLRSIRRSS